MDKKKMLLIGKWVVMGLLLSANFFSYLVNNDRLNLILAIAILLYSTYEFFQALTVKKLNIGIKMYLFTFYLFAVLSLFLGIRSLLNGNLKFAATSILLIGGDIALILYTIHKMSSLKR